jgi:hypothetical protein
VIPWSEGGPTDLSNLVLLCPAHHRLIHHSGWTIRMRDGMPEFLPPPWLDPDRTPLRNHIHDAAPPRHRQTRPRRFHYGRTAAGHRHTNAPVR